MTAGPHPDLIAWVSGAGSADPGSRPDGAASDIATHLSECEACREEAAELRSLRRSLRASDEAHLSIDTLLAIEAAAARGPSEDNSAAERHLSRCGECREDLEALLRAGRARRTPEPERAPAAARASGISMRARVAWSAAAAVLIAWSGFLLLRPTPRPPDGSSVSPRSEEIVLFAAPSRGDAGSRRLVAGGPATVRVALPFGSEGGAYDVRLERPDGTIVARAETRNLKAGEMIEARLVVPAEPGRYRLVLVQGEGRGEPILYPLDVITGPQPPALAR